MTADRQCSRDEWPVKAYKNLDFLNREAARNIPVHCLTERFLKVE